MIIKGRHSFHGEFRMTLSDLDLSDLLLSASHWSSIMAFTQI